MQIEVVTAFPEFFTSPLQTSIIARARRSGRVDIAVHDLRDYTEDRHRTVDDTPYGGGGGMVFRAGPVFSLWQKLELAAGHCVYLSADGEPLNQQLAIRLSRLDRLVLLCGHYRGIDERIRQQCIDQEISVGDYVLTGGEPAAWIVIDAVVRLLPGVLGNFGSALEDSFQEMLLDCPWYTRPAEIAGLRVPEVLLSGDHDRIAAWRRRQALRRTFERRPELLDEAMLDEQEEKLVAEWRRQSAARDSVETGSDHQKEGS